MRPCGYGGGGNDGCRADDHKEGFDTDEDYGDYLLRIGKTSNQIYGQRIMKAKELLDGYGK